MENPYNLPTKFKYIIQKLNRLEVTTDITITKNIQKLIINKNYFCFIITKDKDYICFDFHSYNIDGYLANRFNTNIYKYLSALEKAYPKNKKQIEEFREWLREQELIREKDSKIADLRQRASDLGCVVTIKSERL